MKSASWLKLSVPVVAAALAASCGSSDEQEANNFNASGGSGGGGDATPDAPYASVSVEPASVSIELALGGSQPQAYKAYASVDGQKTDVTSECSWSVGQGFGNFSAATLNVSGRGGKTTVSASCSGVIGTSDLSVTLKDVVLDPGAPADAEQRFAGATPGSDAMRTPSIEYPLDQAVAPLNIPSVEAQWSAGANDLFHLSISSQYVAIDVYTASLESTLSAANWAAVSQTAAGDALSYSVEGLNTGAPATKYASAPVSLKLSQDRVDDTSIYYWASSRGSLLEQVFGDTDQPDQVRGDCTSCHSLSRSGRRVGYSRCVGGDCNELYAGFMKYDVASTTWVDTVNANGKTIRGSYTTFAPPDNPFPGDDQSVALVALSDGSLELYDPDSGQLAMSNVKSASVQDPGNPSGSRSATMPDWSPDGNSVVFASTPNANQWIDVSDSAIAVMSYSMSGGMHSFGAPRFIVSQPITLASGTFNNFFFPSYSPDGNLIVFNAARAAWRNSSNARAPGQRLMLTEPSGAWVVDLEQLNGPGDLNVTWPHWAPAKNSEYLWVVFSSERDYGHRVTSANSDPSCLANGVSQCKQIWLAAIDKSKLPAPGATSAIDPSSPPVWLPGQDIAADNISPYWSIPSTQIPQ